MPNTSKLKNEEYWNYLISSSSDDNKKEREKAERKASGNIDELFNEIKLGDQNPIYQQRLREKAIEKLATPEVQIQIEHMLKPFAQLLDPNPRSMKRFVNMYQIVQATDLYRGGTIEREKLALWTILGYRWPDLAEYIKENPESIGYVHKAGQDINRLRQEIQDNKDIPDKLKNLFCNPEVINVIIGKGVESSLDVKDIRDITGLYGL